MTQESKKDFLLSRFCFNFVLTIKTKSMFKSLSSNDNISNLSTKDVLAFFESVIAERPEKWGFTGRKQEGILNVAFAETLETDTPSMVRINIYFQTISANNVSKLWVFSNYRAKTFCVSNRITRQCSQEEWNRAFDKSKTVTA